MSTPGFGEDSLTVMWLRNPVSHSSFPVNEGVEGVSRATDTCLGWPPPSPPLMSFLLWAKSTQGQFSFGQRAREQALMVPPPGGFSGVNTLS